MIWRVLALLFAIDGLLCLPVNNETATTVDISLTQLVVRLNDTVELDCSDELTVDANATNTQGDDDAKTDNSLSTQQLLLSSIAQNYSLYLFKKDDLLIHLQMKKLKLRVRGTKDEGKYECGYYKLDKFGLLNYVLVRSWQIKLEEVKKVEPNIFTNLFSQSSGFRADNGLYYDGYVDRKSVNLFTSKFNKKKIIQQKSSFF